MVLVDRAGIFQGAMGIDTVGGQNNVAFGTTGGGSGYYGGGGAGNSFGFNCDGAGGGGGSSYIASQYVTNGITVSGNGALVPKTSDPNYAPELGSAARRHLREETGWLFSPVCKTAGL